MVERLKRSKDLGHDGYAMRTDSGMSAERKRQSPTRFVEEFMPAFG